MGGRHSSLAEKLFEKIEKRDNGCWEWTGRLTKTGGYGELGKHLKAHRVMYELAFGPPGSMHVCHHCDNRKCVRPSHLFLGTHADNMADAASKGRLRCRVRKLTDQQVLEIFASTVPAREIAETYGISRWNVYDIRNPNRTRHHKVLEDRK